jgi:hypothetical protein
LFTSLRWNVARWLDFFMPAALGVAVAVMIALLVVRRAGAATGPVWLAFAALLCVAGAGAVWWMRREWFSRRDALVRLDAVLRLRNRLTSALAGVGEWPEPQPAKDGIVWSWPRILGMTAASVALVWFGGAFRFSDLPMVHAVSEPPAWTETAELLDATLEQRLADPEAVQSLRARLEELREQSKEEWFSHGSLEAGDHLRAEVGNGIAELARQLAGAGGAMSQLDRWNEVLGQDDRERLAQAFDEALRGLEAGTLRPNQAMLDQLKKFDPRNVRALSPEEIAKLREALNKTCQQCAGLGAAGQAIALLGDGDQPEGGPSRGGGAAPLKLREEQTELGTTTTEQLPAGGMENAQLGDVEGFTTGKHEIDPAQFAGPTSGGAITSSGEGGETVWRNDLGPEERKVLQAYFK